MATAGETLAAAKSSVEARAVVAGIGLMIFAGFTSSMMHIGVRYVSQHIPAIETVLLRSVCTLIVTLPVFLAVGRASWRCNNLGLQVIRGCVGVCSMATWYYALGEMPLADAGALSFTTAIFVTLGAALWFHEPVGLRRWSAVAIGLLGAMVVLKPGQGVISWAAIAAIVSSALWAASLLLAKELGKFDSVVTITFYQPLMIVPWAALGSLPVWVTPSQEVWLALAVMGVLAALANYAMVKAFNIADASVIIPADYVRLLWMVGWGYALFGEVPGLSTWVGAALIIGATFFITVREQQLARGKRNQSANDG